MATQWDHHIAEPALRTISCSKCIWHPYNKDQVAIQPPCSELAQAEGHGRAVTLLSCWAGPESIRFPVCPGTSHDSLQHKLQPRQYCTQSVQETLSKWMVQLVLSTWTCTGRAERLRPSLERWVSSAAWPLQGPENLLHPSSPCLPMHAETRAHMWSHVISPDKRGAFLIKTLILLCLALPLVTKPIPNTCQTNTNAWQTLFQRGFSFSFIFYFC